MVYHMLIPDQPLIRKHSYLISWYHAVLALTPLQLQKLEFMPGGGAWGQNLEHLRFFCFFFFSCRKLFVFEQQLLFRVDCLCDLGFSTLGCGKHYALITRVDKPSLAQVRPYPTLVLPYYPTLPYPILPYPIPYLTIPPTLTLPYPLDKPSFKRKFYLSNRYFQCISLWDF